MQVVSNLIDWNMNPQEALNAPRFCIKDGTTNGQIAFEEGFDENLITVDFYIFRIYFNYENNFEKIIHELGAEEARS